MNLILWDRQLMLTNHLSVSVTYHVTIPSTQRSLLCSIIWEPILFLSQGVSVTFLYILPSVDGWRQREHCFEEWHTLYLLTSL